MSHERFSTPSPNAAAPRENGVTRVRGADLSWTAEGDGPVVIWVHGMTNDRWALENAGLYDWAPIVTAGRRLVRYDARGHGRSTGNPDPADYTWTNLAADLLAFVDQLSPDRRVVAVGSSSGTAQIIMAALQAPERFDKLVLSAPPTAWDTRGDQTAVYEQIAQLAEQNGGESFARLTASQPKRGLFAELPDYPPRLCCSDELLPSVLRGGARNDLPDPDEITKLAVPSLVLSWHDDPVHPVSTGRRLGELIAGSQFDVARTASELRTWGDRVVEFLDS